MERRGEERRRGEKRSLIFKMVRKEGRKEERKEGQ
jgi:hypothetical protein